MIREGRADWETPELIVLARSRPEEAVLLTCKNPDASISKEPITKWGGCNNRRTNEHLCMNCQNYGPS
jgi:hypothetical protein